MDLAALIDRLAGASSGLASWLAKATPDFALGAVLGLLLLPIAGAINSALERKRARRQLYDDIAMSYAAVAQAVKEVSIVWAANAKSTLDIDGLFSLLRTPESESDEQRRERLAMETETLKDTVLPRARQLLQEVSLKRYDYLSRSKLEVLFDFPEYDAIEMIFESLRRLKEGNIPLANIYQDIGLFRALFKRLHQRSLRRGLVRKIKGDQLVVALDALKSDAKVMI